MHDNKKEVTFQCDQSLDDNLPLINLVDVPIRTPKFLYENKLVEGVINILAGEGGIGKSTLALDWVAKLTKGELPGDYIGNPIKICLYCPEENGGMIKARLLAAKADMEKIILVGKDQQGQTADLTLPQNIHVVEKMLRATKARVLVVDPLSNLVSGDSNKLTDVRKSLNPLAGLAESMEITIVGILHFGKAQGRNARNMISGSKAYDDICRSLLSMARDPQTDRVIVTHEKANYIALPSCQRDWSFRLESVEVKDEEGKPVPVGHVTDWRQSAKSVDDVLRQQLKSKVRNPNKVQTFLIDILSNKARKTPDGNHVGLPVHEIEQFSDKDWSKYQLTDAKRRCKAVDIGSKKYGNDWWWFIQKNQSSQNQASIDDSACLATRQVCQKPDQEPLLRASEGPCQKSDKDQERWYSDLPQQVSRVDIGNLANWQLRLITERRAGLWKSLAKEELDSRKKGDTPASPSGMD